MKKFILSITIIALYGYDILAQDYDWPAFSGPNGNMSGAPSGTYLLEELSYAKLLWSSEEQDLGRGKFTTSEDNGSNTGVSSGGHASPVIYDGLIYVSYFRGSGTEYDLSMYNTAIANGETPTPEFYRIRADDLMVAISLDSGKTVWKKQYPQSGMNIWMGKRDGWAVTPIAFGGKVFHLTTLGELYCYHAKTGAQIWKSTNGINKTYMQGLLSAGLSAQNINGGDINFNFGLEEADGILIVGDYQQGLYGIDTANGAELWHKTGIRRGCATPTIVPVGSKKYVLIANNSSQMSLIDPVNGSYLWQVNNVGGNTLGDIPASMFNYKDVIVHTVNSSVAGRGSIVGTRITTSGPQLLWKLDTTYYHSVEWDQGPRPWYTVKDSIFYCLPSCGKLLYIHGYTGNILYESISSGDLPMIFEDRLFTCSDLYHAPTNQNSFSQYTTDPYNVVKLGGWEPPHKNSGGYDVPMIHCYSNGKLVFRSAVVHNPPNGKGGDLRCYDLIFHPQVFSSFVIEPQTIILNASTTTSYTFSAKDQAGINMKKTPQITWSVSGGGIIDTNGVLTTAATGGDYFVYATAVIDSITLHDTATFTIKYNQSISCPSFTVFTNTPAFDLTCTATSGLPVSYSKISGPFTLSGSTFTALGVTGTARITVSQPGNAYYLPATNYLLNITIQLATDIEPVTNKELLISPNPTDGLINISKLYPDQPIEIYSVLGEKIATFRNTGSIDLSSLAKGIYFIKAGNRISRIIKQ